MIKAEEPPNIAIFVQKSSNHDDVMGSSFSGLMCPKCKQPTLIRFCRNCGKEGFLKANGIYQQS